MVAGLIPAAHIAVDLGDVQGGEQAVLVVDTDYPWDGLVRIEIGGATLEDIFIELTQKGVRS